MARFQLPADLPTRQSMAESTVHYPTLMDSLSLSSRTCQILDDLEPALLEKVREQCQHPERRQVLIELLGPLFQWKLLRSEPDDPNILVRPATLSRRSFTPPLFLGSSFHRTCPTSIAVNSRTKRNHGYRFKRTNPHWRYAQVRITESSANLLTVLFLSSRERE